MPTQLYPKESTKQPKASSDCRVVDLGFLTFDAAYAFQQKILHEVIHESCPDTLIFCQHPHTITLGRLAKKENILVPPGFLIEQGISVFRIDRGGDVTYHGPGQLVAYPIFNLARHEKDLKKFLNNLEQVVIDFLLYFGIKGIRKSSLTGVWVEDKKVGSIGIGVRKWITFHGLAININTDLKYFSLIRPCGLNKEMTSLEMILERKIEIDNCQALFLDSFRKIFNFN
ncbi:MAG: lipoyl(octanoyl) transferase LipB [Candidatus Omnitrophota bacterium]|nr:lipoyl(octanoyl) transferase LipB [Candidatus Omnitrophota bacterium]